MAKNPATSVSAGPKRTRAKTAKNEEKTLKNGKLENSPSEIENPKIKKTGKNRDRGKLSKKEEEISQNGKTENSPMEIEESKTNKNGTKKVKANEAKKKEEISENGKMSNSTLKTEEPKTGTKRGRGKASQNEEKTTENGKTENSRMEIEEPKANKTGTKKGKANGAKKKEEISENGKMSNSTLKTEEPKTGKKTERGKTSKKEEEITENGKAENPPMEIEEPKTNKTVGTKKGKANGAKKKEEISENGKTSNSTTEPEEPKSGTKRSRQKETPKDEEKLTTTKGKTVNTQLKRPKRAATSSNNYKEKPLKISQKDSVLTPKEKNRVVDEELVAIELTKLESENPPFCRKILDFVLHDSEGNPQPFEMSEIDDFYITALIMPMDDNLERERERGVRCEGFGRIESWSISGYDEGTAVIWVSTEFAEYECVKPAGNYKKFYERFYEKARICVEIYRKLAKSVGGNPDLGFEELLAGVVRSIGSSKDFIIGNGEFVYNQLVGFEDYFSEILALLALREECKSRNGTNRIPPSVPNSNGSIKIKDNEKSHEEIEPSVENEDEKLARLLQEEEDWKQMKQQQRNRQNKNKNVYIKISEEEIANDYPLPAYYKPINQETDEYIFDQEDSFAYDSEPPRRILNNWALYNADSRLISLELVPMEFCAENDAVVFGSGLMREDDGCGFEREGSGSNGSGGSNGLNGGDCDGVPIYLSGIKEWMVEFGSEMVFISIRTDVAWYRLGKPTKQYAPWYDPVLKTAKLAISIITLLKEQSRASKLSFSDVIKKLAEFEKSNPAFISSNQTLVERYVTVHGQIILQQFKEFPDETIKKCAFVTGLVEKMEQRRHVKLLVKKKGGFAQKGESLNLNPSAQMAIASKRKVMRATTTKFINRIWSDYYANNFPDDNKNENENEVKEIEEEIENEEEENEIENEVNLDEKESICNNSPTVKLTKSRKSKSGESEETEWVGEKFGKTESGELTYRKAVVKGLEILTGGAVLLDEGVICYVEYMYEKKDKVKMVHGRVMQKGVDTVLGNTANEREVFLTNECLDFEIQEVKEVVLVSVRNLPFGHMYRKENMYFVKNERIRNEEREKKGLPIEYYCKSLYCPEKGGFFSLTLKKLGLGNGVCNSCEERESGTDEFRVLGKNLGFVYNKVEYKVGDFAYVLPQFFDEGERGDKSVFKAGRNVGLKPYVVCQLIEILDNDNKNNNKEANAASTEVKVRRFYRPDDISSAKAYSSDIREVYYSEEMETVPIEMIDGKCEVTKKKDLLNLDLNVISDHIFFCEYSYDPTSGSLKQLSPTVKFTNQKSVTTQSRKNKGKAVCTGEDPSCEKQSGSARDDRLATLDIFAGCGGLSEGLQQSGASFTKWAIEYEQPAGEAFLENHPEASVFIDNCNVILRAIMEKCGDAEDCISTTEANELASKYDEEKITKLPVPGQVDFINGGPPCQGFSGMNRFNQSTWSKVQCEMILAFLSFADYFRPKYFLLENVRNFVSFNKGQTFRLALASLLEMGYQVRFGILEAGAYGVAQSRKRAFIWAASPDETLPDWPEPMHVFASPELKINLSDGTYYSAAPSTAAGAPFRAITVRDTIGDLPGVKNGANKISIDYGSEPVSWFQKKIRGNMTELNDHISKEMNELNLIRCQHIPKRPGADWHDLPDEKVKLSTGQTVDLIPWCLPNTAKRHNQWKGLFGRLDWEGNFPTSITDPQPMGKVGMCFHPDQDRILTVRECARSQGFPDSYKFSGNIQNKHRQIGNAVPPPLAFALGRKLKQVALTNKSTEA
ncbi:hypothetical protein LUZ60_010198 [Juncus effusus]|nr:hypothetical protein LUZ60_010198 [Juncus effusus]